MKLLDLTLDSPAENLALDEALLEEAEGSSHPVELLRLWEPREPMVVVGRGSRVADEVNRNECSHRRIPIFRRTSGGAAIVTGRGCLMYGVVLSYEQRPALRMIEQAHRFVLSVMAEAIGELVPGIRHQGLSDLTVGVRKFSGNSLRCKRTHLLYHGTLLYDFPLELIGECLRMPPRQPDYREGREHNQFVMNLPVDPTRLRQAIIQCWHTDGPLVNWPKQLTTELARDRYSTDEWNFRL